MADVKALIFASVLLILVGIFLRRLEQRPRGRKGPDTKGWF